MFRVVRSLWIWLASGTLIAAWVPLLGVIRLTDRHPLHLRTGRWFRLLGRLLARINPWHIHLAGTANFNRDNTYVIVSNHQSIADIPVVAHLRIDAKWLGKAELFRVPAAGWMMRMAGDIPVERTNARQAAHALLQCARHLRAGCSVVFFPEGTRSPAGEVMPFNDGPFQLAIREHVPVLPVVVDGTGNCLPKHSLLFGGSSDIHLHVLPPVAVDGLGTRQTAELRELVRRSIIDELHRIRAAAEV